MEFANKFVGKVDSASPTVEETSSSDKEEVAENSEESKKRVGFRDRKVNVKTKKQSYNHLFLGINR